MIFVVLGCGASFMGYSQSSQIVTETHTQTYTTTSTSVSATSTETLTLTTSSQGSTLDRIISLEGTAAYPGPSYCGIEDDIELTIAAGQVRVSYTSDRNVDFWLLNAKQWDTWQKAPSCEELRTVDDIAHRFDSKSYDITASIPESANYYIAFLNSNRQTISIALHIEGASMETVVTTTRENTVYSTLQIPLVTQTEIYSSYPVGLGLLFFAGIGLIVVAGVVLAFRRRKGATPSPASVPQTTPVASTAPPVSSARPARAIGKFCINCGASLPMRATFCDECGTKQ